MTYLLIHCNLVSDLFDERLLFLFVQPRQIVEEAGCHSEVLRFGRPLQRCKFIIFATLTSLRQGQVMLDLLPIFLNFRFEELV